MTVQLSVGERAAERAALRFLASATTVDSTVTPFEDFHAWFARRAEHMGGADVTRIPFADMTGWRFQPDTGNLVHDSGRFFTIEGLRVHTDRSWVSTWTQPIIVQPEIGVLGIIVKEFDGVLHCLMQAKMEPGNVNRVQLSPTVQATRSNYTRVHNGAEIRYLEYFRRRPDTRVLVDVLQSEQGSWFLHKRNRNMMVEIFDDLPPHEDFRWLTLGQIRRLLRLPHMVNMDARTVLSCVPSAFSGPAMVAEIGIDDDSFTNEVRRSMSIEAPSLHPTSDVLSWLTDVRTRRELVQKRVPLHCVTEAGWLRTRTEITHEDGRFFDVIAVHVRSAAREVASWCQPLVAPNETGLLAFLAKRIDGVLHVLVQARVDAGSLNIAEMAPTVHCQPGNYADVPREHRPPFLDEVLTADPARIRYDAMQSEEGGRFYHAKNRYLVVDVDADFADEPPAGYCWLTLGQLTGLLVHSNYLNVELRSLIACIQAA